MVVSGSLSIIFLQYFAGVEDGNGSTPGVEMVDFKKLAEKPPMTEAEREQLWQYWYNGLRKTVDKMRRKV